MKRYKKSYKTYKTNWLGFILAVLLLIGVCSVIGFALVIGFN